MAEFEPSEWFVERGIAETRALRTIDGDVIAAKLLWPGEVYAGQQIEAQLTSKAAGARRGTARTSSGQDILVDHLPADVTEGERLKLTISRGAIAEKGRAKHAQARVSASDTPARQWLEGAREVREFASGCWEDIWHAASSGVVEFEGGCLTFSVTPAMTLIDVDGEGSPREVALAATPFISRWLPLFDLGGNIGIDFPNLETKADRKAVDAALDEALDQWPHERTAMNGFGFVQIVARLEGPSLLHRFATSRVAMCARMALRLAERATGTGSTLQMTVHPALKAKLKPEWLEDLARRTGKQVRIETAPGLALEAPQAQILSE